MVPAKSNFFEEPESEQPEADTAATHAVIRVLLADSQAIYRVGMRKIFALEDDIRVVSQVDSIAGLHEAVERFPCDIVMLEGNLLSGTTDAIPEIVRRAPNVKIIIQTMASDESNTVELYRRGVRGIIPRSISPDLLVKCVRKIAAGETWIDNQSVNWVIEAYRSQAMNPTSSRTQPRLSPKELAIITCITQGKRNKEIAYQLGTTEQVIKNYLRKVYDKLGVSDRLELALYCLHHELHKSSPEAAGGSTTITSEALEGGKTNGHAPASLTEDVSH
ncbi:MAG TPA: response regulator transcription factor [Acidisarcina sp.]|nr:response regulator transcription factor [Acidisarcina sp.]